MDNMYSQKDLDVKVMRCCDGINKTVHIIANEPSLGLYRIQQHVRKTMPKLCTCKESLLKTDKDLSGLVYDCIASVEVVKEIGGSMPTFNSIDQLLKKAITSAAFISMKHPPVDMIKF